MKYKSSKGTIVNIPDGLTPQQIAAIKKDADAGYGTRAQQTADALGKKLTTNPAPQPQAPAPNNQPPPSQSGPARDPAKVRKYEEAINRIKKVQKGTPEYQKNADIIKSIGTEYGFQWQDKADYNAPAVGSNNDQVVGGDAAPGTSSNAAAAAAAAAGATGTTTAAGISGGSGAGIATGAENNPDGTTNAGAASATVSAAEAEDWRRNWLAEHPDEMDENGNILQYTMDPDGTIHREIREGERAKFFSDQAKAAAEGFKGDENRKAAEEATYSTLTKYYDRDMARDRERAQQEMANRGIPYDPAAEQDPNTKNLYGRTLGGLNERYRGLKDTARQQAILSGNQAYETDVKARDTAIRDALAGSAAYGSKYGAYGNSVYTDNAGNVLDIIKLTAQQYATKYGMDLADAQSLRDKASKDATLAAQVTQWEKENNLGTKTLAANVADWKRKNEIAAAAVAKSGSGGGGSSGGSSSGSSGGGGFELPS